MEGLSRRVWMLRLWELGDLGSEEGISGLARPPRQGPHNFFFPWGFWDLVPAIVPVQALYLAAIRPVAWLLGAAWR